MVVISCLEEPDCFTLNNNIVGFSIRDTIRDSTGIDTFAYFFANRSKTFRFTDTTSVVKEGDRVGLPVDFLHDSTELIFYKFNGKNSLNVQDTLIDTLVVAYRTQAQYVSDDCGERFVLSNLRILRHTFDEVRLLNREPGRDNNARNIEIYYYK